MGIRSGFIQHVGNAGRDFKDEKLFYRFDEKMILKQLREIREALLEAHKKGMTHTELEIASLYEVSPQQLKGTRPVTGHRTRRMSLHMAGIKGNLWVRSRRNVS